MVKYMKKKFDKYWKASWLDLCIPVHAFCRVMVQGEQQQQAKGYCVTVAKGYSIRPRYEKSSGCEILYHGPALCLHRQRISFDPSMGRNIPYWAEFISRTQQQKQKSAGAAVAQDGRATRTPTARTSEIHICPGPRPRGFYFLLKRKERKYTEARTWTTTRPSSRSDYKQSNHRIRSNNYFFSGTNFFVSK